MNAAAVATLVEEQLAQGEPFTNYHGITSHNLRSFLVAPYQIPVDPDDLETEPRNMWVVLEEPGEGRDRMVVVYDPDGACWGVAERAGDGESAGYTLVLAAKSLAGALDGM
jgi:hypothetical protein